MTQTSEWVSPGHPDKVADGIVAYILDRYIERDPKVRFGLECQVKDNHVCLGGEITSTYEPTREEYVTWIWRAICDIGYTDAYAAKWGKDNALNAYDLDVDIHIGYQSPDIAQGVNADGWGDQGIMWGMATGTEKTGYMPADHYLAKHIGQYIYDAARTGQMDIGLDIKTQVTIVDGQVTRVIVAAPMQDETPRFGLVNTVRHLVKTAFYDGYEPPFGYEVIVNGTGAYVRHASQGDCGTTGRKLAVDFYGGNCRIGGGCPWGKDPSKADVALNVYARKKALAFLKAHPELGTVYCAIACCIGRQDIEVSYFDSEMHQVDIGDEWRPASEIIAELGLRAPVYAALNRDGLFTGLTKDAR